MARTLDIAKSESSLATVRSLLPYLWPRREPGLRLRVVLASLCLVLAKVATVVIPILYARAVDALSSKAGPLAVPAALIVAYALVRIASSGFGELRDALFAAVQQRAARVISRETFEHLHNLSLRFHLDRQTGGLSRVILRGTTGIQTVLRLAVFNVVPTLIELLLTVGILWHMFNWAYAAITLAAVGGYLAFTFGFTSWRIKFRRQMNETDNAAQTKAIDSLLNFETVKYFGNEAHESVRFDASLAAYETAAVRSQVTLNALNLGQAAIIATGLAVLMLMAANGVVAGRLNVGQFVLVNTYLIQLYQPLNFVGFVYRELKQGLVDMEQMFALLRTPQEISDRADAKTLPARGAPVPVEFVDVRFGYSPDREILHGISFRAEPGRKIALVGPTGSGKSTISRLLFRFYDVSEGEVLVDGIDVRDLTQASLRGAIGVVPQDTVLFNDSIRYNIAYGHPGASDAEVERAARLAQIHDFIMSLPQGYATTVGERGLKLSGGEKQRVAIARTILKDPRLLILDEATSALDTATEQDIGAALRQVARDRTTLVIAHRLSTVIDADEILVLRDGNIVERGTHASLLAAGGIYAAMWAAQSEQIEAASAEQGLATGPRTRELPLGSAATPA
ncbi:MAG TPA: ABC transporter ATP-binding protein/permease [Acidiphilium sp.]|jgi:ATP-binding cassette subfamily B protein|uniref:ABCB family ABC transporter ATP-binding protein/permease n=1 Tax=unclassified Acidiphilium TaxID=2617493 RepID=UPI000BC9CA40|nr:MULTISPECIES: ABC transporter ATP-binding protein/permease [unclassified Acidiphilium]OYV57602.1 MAG: metal ABC transporter permease [Acidiphilium sp. 20-67-58]HQT61993.1 ABC transporter ATP-binding protein/permease [Acidiphilium sp.]HQU11589.1 ABC transporter ATP-binding protein/permease [Acidiphilium sp.]